MGSDLSAEYIFGPVYKHKMIAGLHMQHGAWSVFL